MGQQQRRKSSNSVAFATVVVALCFSATAYAEVSPESFLDVLKRLDALEIDNRELRGQNEVLENKIEQLEKSQQQNLHTIDKRINALNKSSGTSSSAMVETSSGPELQQTTSQNKVDEPFKAGQTGNNAQVSMNDQTTIKNAATSKTQQKTPTSYQKETYQAAYNKIKTSPAAAMRSLEEYIKLQPDSPLAANARYWIGEIKYKSRNYKGAIDDFVKVLQTYKDSNKAPDAAVKLGFCFYELKNWEYARRTFNDVLKYFPDNENAVNLAKKRLAMMDEKGN